MQELLSAAKWTHQLFVGGLFILALLNIYFIKKEQMFHELAKQIEFLAPQYYLLLAAILFTGLLVWTVEEFVIKIDVLTMLGVWMIIFITSIIKYQKYKRVRIKDMEGQNSFKNFAKKKYILDIVLIFSAAILSYVL